MGRTISASAQGWPTVVAAQGISQKEPAIRDGCQSREEPQYKSIRGSVVCRNSHTHTKTLRTAWHEVMRGPEPAPVSVEPLPASVDLLMKRAVPTLRFSQAGLSLLQKWPNLNLQCVTKTYV